jgi:hypothetical protein
MLAFFSTAVSTEKSVHERGPAPTVDSPSGPAAEDDATTTSDKWQRSHYRNNDAVAIIVAAPITAVITPQQHARR